MSDEDAGPSRRGLAIAGVVAGVLLLGFLGWRAALYFSEDTVVLRPQGVDPRDPFRGDYVILRYNESTVAPARLGGDPAAFADGGALFLVLAPGEPTHRAVRVAPTKPDLAAGETCLKGTIERDLGGGSFAVDYGIESLFVPEGRGLEAERAIREGRALVEVKSGFGCNAAIGRFLVDDAPWP